MDLSTVPTRGLIGRPSLGSVAPAWTAVCYFIAAEAGIALSLSPVPMPHLRPAAAVLLAALLAQPAGNWWRFMLAVLPAHLLAGLHHGIVPAETLPPFLGNAALALLGAGGMHLFLRGPVRFDGLRHVVAFIYWCGFLAPGLVAWPEAALRHGPEGIGLAWVARLFSGAAVILALVPPLANWPAGMLARLRQDGVPRQVEAALLAALLVLVALMPLSGRPAPPALAIFAPLAVLFWTAVRFGPFGSECVLLLFALLLVADTAAGRSPFVGDAQLLLPLFLSAVAVPMLLLAAALQERRGTLASLQREQEKLGQALAAERKRAERLARERRARAEVEQRVAERTVELRRANTVLCAEVAARRKALEAERAAAARFSNLFRLSPDAMAISGSVHGPLLDVNDHWQQLFGYPREDVLGRQPAALGLFQDAAGPDAVAARLARDGAVRDLEVRMRNRDGEVLQVLLSGAAIAADGEQCFLAIMRDVTAQRRAEAEVQRQREQLTHLTRVVVLGELSGALAHELNQPLAAILTNAQAARRFLARPDPDLGEIDEILRDIVDEDKRAGEVIRRLRALFKKEAPVLRPLAVSALVRETLELTHGNLVERNVQVLAELQDGLCVLGDRVQLQQVLLNLVVNACDAMRATPAPRRRLRLASAALSGGRVQITVADGGSGIAQDAIGKVFDPFFTTKPEGLGFGLSISRAIICQHGGQIEAVNNRAGGCTFRIRLPAHGGGQ